MTANLFNFFFSVIVYTWTVISDCWAPYENDQHWGKYFFKGHCYSIGRNSLSFYENVFYFALPFLT